MKQLSGQKSDPNNLTYLAELIERSRKRSVAYKVNPAREGAPESNRLSREALKKRMERNGEFFSAARYELDSLYSLLKNTGFCSALTDQDGYVLYTIGDEDILEQFHQRNCSPGYRWTEKDMGTCAIGLALEEKIPVFLPGEQMYVARTQGISNAGAPVFGPDGKTLLGVICLSGYSEKMHIHTLGLVRQCAERITAVLREKLHLKELELQNQYMKALLESSSKGMITVDLQGGIVQSNRKACLLLNIPAQGTGIHLSRYIDDPLNISEYLNKGSRLNGLEIRSSKSKGSHFASLDPIYNEKREPVGGLITVTEKDELMHMAAKLSGTQALFTFDSILGNSEPHNSALHLARISAGSTVSVLLSGETGTGKELFAQAIHNESDRWNQPFVAINCGAIPNELFESELFGYEEGAFSGAQRGGRPGKLELANNGTLFLDEIGDMPFDMQVKLLRVLQSGELQRVGGLRSIPVNLRIISATNLNLKQAIKDGKFRDDLYYRICTLKIDIPALRERRDDIPVLAEYFIRRQEKHLGKKKELSKQETIHQLMNYPWPGNIRQLENAVERAAHLCEGGELLPEHFGISSGNEQDVAEQGSNFRGCTLAEVEKRVLLSTIEELEGNIRQAAIQLGISRPTIYRKMKQYGIAKKRVKNYTG